MLLLGIETSSNMGSLALVRDDKVQAKKIFTRTLGHSGKIIPACDQLLRKARVSLCDLDAVAVGIGPGSYTGLRVGVAAAKGLALLSGIPVVGVPSMDALVLAHEKKIPATVKRVFAAADAKREESYLGEYRRVIRDSRLATCDSFRRRGKIKLIPNKKLQQMRESGKWVCGPDINSFFPSAEAVALFAACLLKSGRPLREPEPIYIRPFIPKKLEHHKWTRFVVAGLKSASRR